VEPRCAGIEPCPSQVKTRISFAVGLSLFLTVATVEVVLAEDKGKSLVEKRDRLIKKCQQVIPLIPSMPRQQQKDMAALMGKTDAELKVAKNVLNGTTRPLASSDSVVRQYLDDAEFFLSEITSCAESTKRKKPCSLSSAAQAVLRSFTEDNKAAFLKDLPSFCRN